jgi:cytoskeletal protein CcmA (bactofilin family)
VKVEGRVEGSIRSARQVLVGRQGVVQGDIETREAIIGGTVEGTITASERVEIQATAVVNGDVVTRTIVIAEGGKINGSVKMEEQRSPARAATASSSEVAVTAK